MVFRVSLAIVYRKSEFFVGFGTQRPSFLISSGHESWHTSRVSRIVKLLAKTVRNVPDVGAQYAECYYQQQSSSNDDGSRDTHEVVDQSSHATRGARPTGSLAQFRRTRAHSLTHCASLLFLYLSSRFLSSSLSSISLIAPS